MIKDISIGIVAFPVFWCLLKVALSFRAAIK